MASSDSTNKACLSPDYSKWQAPEPNDVRSPCPALNALANHGFLPRDGRKITLPMLEHALPVALNVDVELARFFFNGAVKFGLTRDGMFDLSDLNAHNAIEHDGSLSRADAHTGDNYSFNQEIFDSYMKHFDGSDILTPATAGRARMIRIKTEQKRNSAFKYGLRQKVISNGETSLILSVFGDIHTGNANKEHVRIFFEQERLPAKEGWNRPGESINLEIVGKMTTKVLKESGEKLADGIAVVESAVMDALRWVYHRWED